MSKTSHGLDVKPSRSGLQVAATRDMPGTVADNLESVDGFTIAERTGSQTGESGTMSMLAPRPADGKSAVAIRSTRTLEDIIAVDFDLVGKSPVHSGLSVRKPLFVNGEARGQVTLLIARDSRIVARLADLQSALGGSAIANLEKSLGEAGFVGFDALRKIGIAVRYDAAKDVVRMTAETGKN